MGLSQQGPRKSTLNAIAMLIDRAAHREAAVIAPHMDGEFYLRSYPDVAKAGLDPAYHYAKYGWHEGRDPSPNFSTKGYLLSNPGLAMRQDNPFLHFVRQSKSAENTTADHAGGQNIEQVIDVVRPHVDSRFYAARYPSFEDLRLDAAEHYCRFGWREGFDPAPDFSTSYYLLTNPDIKASGINPFWHFLMAGKQEGRLPIHPGGWRHAILSEQKDFNSYCKDWLRSDEAPDLLVGDDLIQALGRAQEADRLLISVGHDDYRASPGGVQLCIQVEEMRARESGFDYLNMHPWQPLPKLADPGSNPVLTLVLNGKTVGATTMPEVITALRRLNSTWHPADLIVHHLAGQATEDIAGLLSAIGLSRCRFWLHDYFTLCTSYALQRNNVAPCSAPDASSNACNVCLFGEVRPKQIERMHAFFDAVDVSLIAPSTAALSFWKSRTSLRVAEIKVHPHMKLARQVRTPAIKCDPKAPVRIAFVGTKAPHKGWPVFVELYNRLATTNDVEFSYFGSEQPVIDGISHVHAHVTSDDPFQVSRMIEEHQIDLVLHWAAWRETFSFSAFEALVGGAFLLTNSGSGNVAAAVRKHRRGHVLETADELYEMAKNGGLRTLAENARLRRSKTQLVPALSGMSVDLLDGVTPA